MSEKLLRKLNQKPKLKMIVKLKRKLLFYSLKPRLELTLRLKLLLMLPLLLRPKGFSFSSLAWMLYQLRLAQLLMHL